MKAPCRAWVVVGLALCVSVCGEARADIPPAPTRPGWRDHAPPAPDAPDEELVWALGALSVVSAGAAAGAWWTRTQRRPTPEAA